MVGALSTVVDVIGAVNKLTETNDEDVSNIIKALNNTKSITERAKKALFVYPVLFSPGVSDVKIASKISKFLEIQYGIFTTMTVGLMPSVEDGNISNYLNSISAEGYNLTDKINLKIYNVNPNHVELWYEEFKRSNEDFFEEYKGFERKETLGLEDEDEDNQNNKKKKGEFNSLNPLDITEDDSLDSRASTDQYKTIDKLKSGNPTMINLKVKIKGYDQDFVIPIGLKANPHFVSQSDLAALFDSAIEDKRLLTRIVKLSSGEISFFKDFLFAMDRAKRDQQLYAKFGQHPWYRQFIQKKENNGLKKIGIIFSNIFGKFKGVVNSTSNFLPTATIVMTLDECERSTKMKYGFLLKHEKILWDVLNHLGLLCICIYNPELETCDFYFNGFKKPMLVPLSEMKSDKEDATAEMAKVMQQMMKRGIM